MDCRPVRQPVSGVARYCIEIRNRLEALGPVRLSPFVQSAENAEALSELNDHDEFVEIIDWLRPRSIRNLAIETSPRLVDRLLPAGFDLVHETYFARLVASARQKMPQRLSRVADEEDIALSAMCSFFRGMQENKFDVNDRGDLWKLLVSIASHKASGERRFLAQATGWIARVTLPKAAAARTTFQPRIPILSKILL